MTIVEVSNGHNILASLISMYRLHSLGKGASWKHLVVVVLSSLVIVSVFLWIGRKPLTGITVPNALLAGFPFTGVTLGNLLVGLAYVGALQYTKSVLENDELSN